jgi:pSer/pThr/pTyr-binding forkhead associated (FHA) protein
LAPFRLPLCGLLIGRSTQCDLVLDDPDASRRHAQFMLLDSKPWIVDLASSNGTLVNGHSVRRERLTEGAELVLGRTKIRLRAAIKGDHVLPEDLLEAWNPLERGLAVQKTERLRRLAGAETCAWVEGAHPVFHWAENGKWEDLGPVRKQLLQELIG